MTDLAMRRAILTQKHQLSRGLWVIRASFQTAFLAAMGQLCISIIATFSRGIVGNRETIHIYFVLELALAMNWALAGIALALFLALAHTWLTKRRDAMIADCHSARIELLNYLSRSRC